MVSRSILALVFVLTNAACASAPSATPAPAPASSPGAARNVDGAEARKLVAGGAKLVDVRSPAEYAEKHIAGAENVPDDTAATHDFGPKDGAIVVYCRAGARSARVAEALRARGYTHVYELGPMSRWDEGAGK